MEREIASLRQPIASRFGFSPVPIERVYVVEFGSFSGLCGGYCFPGVARWAVEIAGIRNTQKIICQYD
jgi:hypothetical protein